MITTNVSTDGIGQKSDFNGQALRKAAEDLEASFLAEMLKSAGFGKPRESFGGGAGEDQFASFLRMEQARAMVRSGGIGLTEAFYNALKETSDVQVPD
ncbi:rod-binding protein [Shimia sp.]|uniref:rod-binding protein n=1 Tax=Shimia sp. TaxID=1954381 RepID=UPI003296ACFC